MSQGDEGVDDFVDEEGHREFIFDEAFRQAEAQRAADAAVPTAAAASTAPALHTTPQEVRDASRTDPYPPNVDLRLSAELTSPNTHRQVGCEEPALEFEVQGCGPQCTHPCMDGCGWSRCFVLDREANHCWIRMADNLEEMRVLSKYVRPVGAPAAEATQGRPKRQRK